MQFALHLVMLFRGAAAAEQLADRMHFRADE
jgi:hypothetical protein